MRLQARFAVRVGALLTSACALTFDYSLDWGEARLPWQAMTAVRIETWYDMLIDHLVGFGIWKDDDDLALGGFLSTCTPTGVLNA